MLRSKRDQECTAMLGLFIKCCTELNANCGMLTCSCYHADNVKQVLFVMLMLSMQAFASSVETGG